MEAGVGYPAPMPGTPPHAVRCLKEAGRRSVWLIQRPGEGSRTLKTWPLTPTIALKLLLGLAQPQRQIRGAERLAKLGIRTPSPVGRWRFLRLKIGLSLALELDYIPGRLALDVLTEGRIDPAVGRPLAAEIGAAVRLLAEAKLLHRDLKLSNIVIAEEGDRRSICVLDPVGVRPMFDRLEALLRMFDRLRVEPAEMGIDIPRWAWAAVLRETVRGLPRADRRAVIRRLKSHLQP